jgi:predicted amidophosphoribosyltransferase
VPVPDRTVGGVVVRSAWAHEGAARRLVHRLKYQGTWSAAAPLVARLVDRIRVAGDVPTALVPLPRAQLRRGIHGIDPAQVLARGLGAELGVPVVRAVDAAWWWPHHAGRGKDRVIPGLRRSRLPAPGGAAFVDDVVTTGSTLLAAGRLLPGVHLAFTATSGGTHTGSAQRDVGLFTGPAR